MYFNMIPTKFFLDHLQLYVGHVEGKLINNNQNTEDNKKYNAVKTKSMQTQRDDG